MSSRPVSSAGDDVSHPLPHHHHHHHHSLLENALTVATGSFADATAAGTLLPHSRSPSSSSGGGSPTTAPAKQPPTSSPLVPLGGTTAAAAMPAVTASTSAPAGGAGPVSARRQQPQQLQQDAASIASVSKQLTGAASVEVIATTTTTARSRSFEKTVSSTATAITKEGASATASDPVLPSPQTQSPSQPPAQQSQQQLKKGLNAILGLFVLLKVLLSFDSGAFSSSLALEGGIADDLGLSAGDQGTLSSSVFLGNMVGCAVAGQLFVYFSAKRLLVFSVIAHGVFTFLFAASSSYGASLIIRFFIGLTLAFIVVYTPIWVDEFAPKHRATTWMALCNVGVPVGIMLGFVCGGLLPVYTSLSWRSSFYLKCILLVPVALFTSNADRALLDNSDRRQAQESNAASTANANTNNDPNANTVQMEEGRGGGAAAETSVIYSQRGQHSADGITANATTAAVSIPPVLPTSSAPSTDCAGIVGGLRRYLVDLWQSSLVLGQNPRYVFNVCGLSSLYFVVTALQNFVTPYLRDPPFGASMDVIVGGFGASVVTAPVMGVIAGGLLLDRLGGYHNNAVVASRFACAWGLAAAGLSVLCALATSTAAFLVPMWALLCCGGAIVPAIMGLVMASVDAPMRPAASSLSNIAFNLLGYFLGPVFCGYVTEATGSLAWGIRATLSASGLGLVLMFAALAAACRHEGLPLSPTPAGIAAIIFRWSPPKKAGGVDAAPAAGPSVGGDEGAKVAALNATMALPTVSASMDCDKRALRNGSPHDW